MNSFGRLFRFTSFGESHGFAIGGVIDGIPSNIKIDLSEIQKELDRRRPGQSHISTARQEKDKIKILSGLSIDNLTLGTPIAFIVENEDQRSKDYNELENIYRPSHADYTYQEKYGIRDPRGGGRSSARETLVRVAVGAFAKQFIKKFGIEISAFTTRIGSIKSELDIRYTPNTTDIESNIIRTIDVNLLNEMILEIEKAKEEGDSVGGDIRCVISSVPKSLGEPIYDKLSARLAYAMMGINAVKSFSIGEQVDLSRNRASILNDEMFVDDSNNIKFKTNNSGGIQGGISNGENIYFDLSIKPTASIRKAQNTINKNNENISLEIKGRHDPCIVPRAIPIVEAMTAIVLADMILLNNAYKFDF